VIFKSLICKIIGKEYYKKGRGIGNGFESVQNYAGLFALKNPQGSVVSDFKYKHINAMCSSACMVQGKNNKFGFINENGEEIIKCEFDGAKDFKDNVAVVKQYDRYGVINKKGVFILPCRYRMIDIVDGVILTKEFDKGWRAFNLNGEELIKDNSNVYVSVPPVSPMQTITRNLCDYLAYNQICSEYQRLMRCKRDGFNFAEIVYAVTKRQFEYASRRMQKKMTCFEYEAYIEKLGKDLEELKQILFEEKDIELLEAEF